MVLDREILWFDLETTGVDAQTARVVEIAAARMNTDGAMSPAVATLVNPGVPIPPEATAIHGITDEMVADAPPFSDALVLAIVDQLTPETVLGGFNVLHYDLRVLQAECARHAVSTDWLRGRPVIDACCIFRLREPRDLAAARMFYLALSDDDAHRAAADVRATAAVFLAQRERYADLPATAVELDAFCRGRQADWYDEDGKLVRRGSDLAVNFGKQRGQTLRELARVDRGFLAWILRNDFSEPVKDAVRAALR